LIAFLPNSGNKYLYLLIMDIECDNRAQTPQYNLDGLPYAIVLSCEDEAEVLEITGGPSEQALDKNAADNLPVDPKYLHNLSGEIAGTSIGAYGAVGLCEDILNLSEDKLVPVGGTRVSVNNVLLDERTSPEGILNISNLRIGDRIEINWDIDHLPCNNSRRKITEQGEKIVFVSEAKAKTKLYMPYVSTSN
jgi:hypothetical protein